MNAEATMNEFGVGTHDKKRARLAAKIAVAAPGMETYAGGPMLRTGEVALLFGVSERCIRNWANAGKLPSIRTLGKHRLFPAREVAAVLQKTINGE